MNIDNINEFTNDVIKKKTLICELIDNIEEIKHVYKIKIFKDDYEYFAISEEDILDVNCSSVKTFKILLIEELEQMLWKEEKELKELIENGIEEVEK